ncbi:hypothetical protein DNTS_000679, partial [Danionella cerebrum]
MKTYTEVPLEYDIFSDLNLYLVIGLGSVSFLLLITILVTIVLKCQKAKPSKAAPPSRNSVISERNSTIADSTLVSNDAYWYSLFLAETRKGKLVVRQPVPKGSRYIVSSIPRSTGLTETSDSAASTLQELAVHNLVLTAVDGGVPARSGTASIIVRVLDTNDNAPRFDKESYTINLSENSPVGSLVLKLNATDRDEGSNADLLYSYSLYTSEKTQQTFSLNPNNGEIRVREMINYEDFRIYDMEVTATDKGANSLSGKCKVKILISDMNDNHPEISIKSFSSPVKEDVPVNTVIAVVSVSDKDSGENGQVDVHISDHLPFTLKESSDNYYQLLVSEPLDREKVPEYDITITVTDRGVPPLSDNETITLELLDVNDNIPQFPQSSYRIPVMENNAPGASLSSITAFDPDLNENQYLVYFILEKEIANTSMSMLFSINPENGNLYALKTFDYEMEKEFQFHIEARDSGVPPLSSNVSVHVIIMDQNDNTPLIVSPWRPHGSEVRETIPRSTDKGTLISKVIAIDSDSVHNSRITYQFLQNTDATLFSLDQYNGEIRTMRMFSYRDSRDQRL